jgi:putative membrane protein
VVGGGRVLHFVADSGPAPPAPGRRRHAALPLERFFSPADHAAIAAAVRDLEARSAGEIVPYAVERSDRYTSALWTAATLGGLAGGFAAAFLRWLGDFWTGHVALWIALPPASGAALGWLLALALPGLRRLLVPSSVLTERVRQRASEAFLAEEVFHTRDRTGILIFLSLFERRVVVRADRGLDDVVTTREWEEIVDGIAAGMREGRPGPALAEGIRRCASLAERVPPRADDRDELPGQLRMRLE